MATGRFISPGRSLERAVGVQETATGRFISPGRSLERAVGVQETLSCA